jgi:hypothetical protein
MLLRLVSITASQSARRHLQEHAVARDAGVVDQHVDGAVLGLGLAEGAATVESQSPTLPTEA